MDFMNVKSAYLTFFVSIRKGIGCSRKVYPSTLFKAKEADCIISDEIYPKFVVSGFGVNVSIVHLSSQGLL